MQQRIKVVQTVFMFMKKLHLIVIWMLRMKVNMKVNANLRMKIVQVRKQIQNFF